MSSGTLFKLEVNPKIPRRLVRLEELAGDLWYSWHRPTRTLFSRLDRDLWQVTGNAPREFLRRVDEQRLVDAAGDGVFLALYNQVLSAYDTYHGEGQSLGGAAPLRAYDLVAYFCAEFGFHESFPIYSGGLGILAGDHCKAASDLRLPFVGVGLLYRQGYFHQRIDADGNQIAHYTDSDFDSLPVTPCKSEDGHDLLVPVEMPGRTVHAKVWRAKIGHVALYLLDTDVEQNSEADRGITHQLYGGDREMRIKQELVLGVGGVRMLQALGLKPTAWHINEGHAAFLVFSRVRKLLKRGVDFAAALEAVATNTVFTTHTPVPAGHDHFAVDLLTQYLKPLCADVDLDPQWVVQLGLANGGGEFNMTALAIRGSRFQNGVSRIHGDISAQICAQMWPQVDARENPLSYVTNGVHVPTFLAYEWGEVFDRYLGHEWRQRLTDTQFWRRVEDIPDHVFWSLRQTLKAQMLRAVQRRLSAQHFANFGSASHLERLLRYADALNTNVLTIGFARRFAVYKRATLLFENAEWLKKIVNNAERPVLFVFAGKAHPADKPGQDLIRAVSHIARSADFEGKVLMLEGYDLSLARRLVSGVDVWLNTPLYPLEASGTSGMKAGINGVPNLSVLDGWWGEGYNGKNGWGIQPAPQSIEEYKRSREESVSLCEILEDQVVPLYYERNNKLGYSEGWVRMAKESIASLMPRFNSTRMVREYVERFYAPASRQGKKFADNDYFHARELSAWKAKVRAAWGGLRVRRLGEAAGKRVNFGDSVRVEVALNLNGLKPEDVAVELLLSRDSMQGNAHVQSERLRFEGRIEGAEHVFALELAAEVCGRLGYRVRVYPFNALLTHPLEMGLMVWL
jgi:glycogen phosphorylase